LPSLAQDGANSVPAAVYIRTFQKHIAILEEKIAQCFKAHPEAWLFRDLPGAGPAMAPRLLVAFGTDRSRYESASNLQKYAGIAPVVERSGSQCWTHWRWQAPRFMRQTFVEWAGQTVIWCDWAKGYLGVIWLKVDLGNFDHVSAGLVEGLNNKIRAVTRESYGFRTLSRDVNCFVSRVGSLRRTGRFTYRFC
jgi:hypothetical protein